MGTNSTETSLVHLSENNTGYFTDVRIWTSNLTDKILITVFFGSIILIGIVGNVLIITIIVLTRKLHSVVNLCLSSLALADLVVLVFLPIINWNILYDLDDSMLGEHFCIFISSIDRGAMVCSVLTFVLVGVERYTVLCHPLKTIGFWTYRKVCLLLAIIWAVTSVVSVPYGYVTRYEEYEFDNETFIYCEFDWDVPWIEGYETVLVSVTVFLPIPALIVLYAKIIISLKAQGHQSNPQGTSARTTKKSRSQVTVMLSVLVTMFIVCVLPFKIYVLIDIYAPDVLNSLDEQSDFAVNWLCRVIVYVNHASNPVVYFLMSRNFRDGFKGVFCPKCKHKHRTSLPRTTYTASV